MNPTIISLHAKCSDFCHTQVFDENKKLIKEEVGYVPKFLGKCQEYGDYISLLIDIETGKILNWDIQKDKLNEFLQLEIEE